MDNSQNLNFLQLEHSQPELSGGEAFGRMIGGLAICLVLVLVGVAVLKRVNRYVGGASVRCLKLKERLPLTSKTSLILVEVGGREVLISVGSESVTELTGGRLDTETPQTNPNSQQDLQKKGERVVEGTLNILAVEAEATFHRKRNPQTINPQGSAKVDGKAVSSDLDLPITLDRPVIELIDQGLVKSKVLADQLIITNPYRQ